MGQTNELYMAGKYAKALELCSEAEALSAKTKEYPLEERANILRSKAHVFMEMGELDSGIVYSQRSLSAYRQSIGPAERLTIDLQYELGYFHDVSFAFDSAIYHYEQCIDLYRSAIGDSTDDIPLTENRLASIYMTLGLLDEAEPHAKEAYRLWVRNFGVQSRRGITASRLLGRLYWTRGQQSKGLLYYEESVGSATVVYKDQPANLLSYYRELSRLYKQMGFRTQSLLWFERADSLSSIYTNPNVLSQASFYHIKAKHLHDEKGQTEAGIAMIHQAIDIYEAIEYKQNYHYVNMADFHTSMAQLLKNLGRYDSARQCIDYAYAIYDSLYPTRRYYGHFERLDIAIEAGDTASFWDNSRKMTQFLVKTDEELPLASLLQKEIQVFPDGNTIKAALRMADRFWLMYQKYPSDTHLKIVRLAFEQLDRWYDPYHRDEVQYSHQMAEQRSWIYKGLLRAYVAEYERSAQQEALQLAFAASEQNKAFSLYKYIKRQSQLSFSGVPDTLVRREAGLKAKISFFNAKLNPNLPDHQFQKWEKELKQLQGEYETLTQQIQNQYPRYYQLLHQNPVLLQDFQSMLGSNERGIVYTRADSVLYAFSFSRREIKVHQLAFSETLEDSILAFREQLFAHSGVNDTDPLSLVHAGSYQLYKQLLEPMVGEEQYDMLYVIPDDILALIPFEVLWTAPSTTSSAQERPYLLRKYPLSYAYSAGLCIEQHGIEPAFSMEEQPLAVFAPNYQEKVLSNMDTLVSKQLSYLVREGLYDLEGARNEAEAISQFFGGRILLGPEASKERFVEIAPDFKLLHLAMHASVLPESPLLSKLIFADTPHDSLGRYLYAAELFALPLDAELVVLSACNTGYGKLQQGEGVMSLAKAFHYAGCPSVVMSLWQVPDQETQQLMTDFYAALKAGKSKSEALRSAKLAYLDQVKAAELAHPFFWAGFVLSGNAQPLEKELSLPPWLWALLALSLVGGGMLAWKKRSVS